MGKYLGDVASDVYGVTTTGTQSLLPRSKFQFSVTITLVDANGTHKSFPLSRIVSIDQPSYSSRVSTLNQYNKKRTSKYNPKTQFNSYFSCSICFRYECDQPFSN